MQKEAAGVVARNVCNCIHPLVLVSYGKEGKNRAYSEDVEVFLVVLRNYLGTIPKLKERFTSGFS